MRTLSVVALCVAATGCAAPTTWNHTAITDRATEERQFDIDKGYCLQAAMGSVSMPNVPYIPPGSDSSRFSGTYRDYNAQTGYTSGQFYGSTSSGGFASGLASGYATGAAMSNAYLARRAQEDIFTGCMKQLGWSESDAVQDEEVPTQSEDRPTTNRSSPAHTAPADFETVESAYSANATLTDWQANNPAMWAKTVDIEKKYYLHDQTYLNMPVDERMDYLANYVFLVNR